MRRGAFFSVCCALALIWVAVKAEQKLTAPSRNWVSQMVNYCEDLADSFKRLESQF
jgi:hypothetical protein